MCTHTIHTLKQTQIQTNRQTDKPIRACYACLHTITDRQTDKFEHTKTNHIQADKHMWRERQKL